MNQYNEPDSPVESVFLPTKPSLYGNIRLLSRTLQKELHFKHNIIKSREETSRSQTFTQQLLKIPNLIRHDDDGGETAPQNAHTRACKISSPSYRNSVSVYDWKWQLQLSVAPN